MIDLSSEALISLSEAARRLPKRRRGKRPHVSCIYRWTTGGCRGVVLDSVQIGGTRCTSHEALERFFHALTAAARDGSPSMNGARSPAKRQRDSEAAGRKLESVGI